MGNCLFEKHAFTTIPAQKIDSITNNSYKILSQNSDKNIKENNQKQAVIYKEAAFFYAK